MKPDLSIIIATLGFDSLNGTLKSIINNKNNSNIEVLIIGNVKEELIGEYKKLKFIKHLPCSFEKGDLSKKRNLGFEKAKADVVAYIDDDVNITRDWIKNGLRHFNNPKVGMVSGPGIMPKKADFSIELFGTTMSSLGSGPIRNRYSGGKKLEIDNHGDKIIGCNMFIRRKVYSEIGGFNPEIIPAEEIDFAARIIKKGYKIYIDPQVYLIHFARSDIKRFFRQIFRFGRSKINTIRRRTTPLKMIYLLPLVTLIFFPILLIFSLFSSFLLRISISLLLLYLIFDIIAVFDSLVRTHRLISILLIFTIPLTHLAYSLGEVCELFSIKTRID